MKAKSRSRPGPFGRFKLGLKRWLGLKVILCDSCKWNWRAACRNPDRPNATWCNDYEKRG